MIIVAVIIYNRFQNLQAWLHCWAQCKTKGAELIIIHTGNEIDKFKTACEGKAQYIHRENKGFDIGAFQDVCRERLIGFPKDWEYLLWVTDDTLPMSKDFIAPFIEALQDESVGISCMKISASVSQHVRTTGFCLRKETALKIQFPADPVTTKSQCYHFEHQGVNNTLTNQVRKMGLACRMVALSTDSPLWDTGYWKRLDRQREHDKIFNPGKQYGDKVAIICTIFNSYPQIISSLLLQTHENWELILIHDGPNKTGLKQLIPGDTRINYIETKERLGNWGHGLRQWALNEIREGRLSQPDFIVVSNADNYLAPVFMKYMLTGFNKAHTSVATFCSHMVHSYKDWQVIPCKLEQGFIDCSGVMVRKEIACEVGWRDTKNHSADWTFFSDIASRYSASNFIKVNGCLLIHN